MSSSHATSKGVLEIFKFGVYVTVPIVLTYAAATDSKFLHKIISARSYMVYPPEGPKPPSSEELREMACEIARKNRAQ